MSWLFSRALAEAFSEENSWDGEPFAQLNVMPTPAKFSRNDKTMEPLSLSRFGLTLQLLTESRGEELLTWYREGFHAKTYPAQAKAQELAANEADFGNKWRELSMKYSRNSHTWKIHRSLFPEVLSPSSVTLPKWGLMRSGVVYQRLSAVQTMREIESGLLLATPTATANQADAAMRKWPSCRRYQDALWLPTPTAHNAKEGGYPAEHTRNTPTFGARLGGRPHPLFNEWMMGWPLGWTDLKPLATGKFPFVPQPLGNYLEAAE